jgi:iron complex outermembrane receptor protein
LARNPRLPDSLNITRRSRKAVVQSQLSLLAARGDGANTVNASFFVGGRTLDNPLPFAIVAVDRQVAGGSLHGAVRTTRLPWPVRLGAGVDAQRQVDDRLNFENCAAVAATAPATTLCPKAGNERGAVRLDQQERIGGLGGYVRVEAEAPHRLFASAALRYDRVHFAVRDRFITAANLDDSGTRALSAVSPMFGIAWRARPLLSVYANLNTAFETPTITELTNQDNGAAGLNAMLDPQRTRTAEVGVQGLLWSRVRADIALFRATVLDELVPFDVPNQPGRRAFRNAGRTSRQGIETNLNASTSVFDVGIAHTWSRFAFDTYRVGTANYDGKVIPGIPAHLLQAYLTARRAGWFATIDGTASSRVSASDASTVFAAGYAAWNARAGYAAPRVGRLRLEPTVGIENLFDRRYAGSVVINATRARFFEPGLPRRLTFVMRIQAE